MPLPVLGIVRHEGRRGAPFKFDKAVRAIDPSGLLIEKAGLCCLQPQTVLDAGQPSTAARLAGSGGINLAAGASTPVLEAL